MIETANDNQAPPSESVWTKYSPNHEFPVATVVSIVIHAVLVALVIVSGFALNRRWHGEASQPPNIIVAYVAPAGNGQSESGGGKEGAPTPRTERVEAKTASDPLDATPFDAPMIAPLTPMPLDARVDLSINDISPKTPDLAKQFAGIERDLKAGTAAKQAGPPGDGGTGNGSGGGNGPGKGRGNGPGDGTGIPGLATRAEVLAQRWRFNPSGSPREHVEKLTAAGVRVGFKDGNDQFWLIRDLKKRPVDFQLESFDKYNDTVKWFSQEPRSVLGMAHELRLPGPPQFFVLLLPKDREQKLADAEFQFAKARNRDLKRVEETWFDFRPVGGAFEPVVVGQVPFEPRPKW
jgi:hypothetical protein